MQPEMKSRSSRPLVLCLAAGAVIGLVAVVWGFVIDAKPEIDQPDLFWPFLVFGLAGSLLGWRIAFRHDRDLLRNAIGLIGSLVAWRVSYFPFMVVAGWKASLGEWLTFNTIGLSVVYPTFLFMLFAQHAGVGFIGAAAIASPQTAPPSEGRFLFLRKLFHRPPRKLLWGLAVVALPVAIMVSFSTAPDFVVFNDAPTPGWEPPLIHEPEVNAYERIMAEQDLGPAPWVLAVNARFTYPLVPHSPWGRAMKGTLEQLALDNPVATTRARVDEHYLAYLAAHGRIHDPNAGTSE